jgi:hypothetical protein
MFFWIILAVGILIVTIFIITGHIWALLFFVAGIFLIIKFIEFLIRNAMKVSQ